MCWYAVFILEFLLVGGGESERSDLNFGDVEVYLLLFIILYLIDLYVCVYFMIIEKRKINSIGRN